MPNPTLVAIGNRVLVAMGDKESSSGIGLVVSWMLSSLSLLAGEGGAKEEGSGNWVWSMECERPWGERRWWVEPAGEANPDSGRSMSVFKLDVLSNRPIRGSDDLIWLREGFEWNHLHLVSAECERLIGTG